MKFLKGVGWLIFLVLRGLLLWVLVPLAFVLWVLVHSWLQQASLRQAISWYDGIFITACLRGPFGFLVKSEERPRFIAVSKMAEIVPHPIGLLDFEAP